MQSKYDQITILLNKLKEENKDIKNYLKLLNELIKLTIDLSNYFYRNNELNLILQFYREITSGYEKAMTIIQHSELPELSSSIRNSYEHWKFNQQIIQKELMKLNIQKGNELLLEEKYEHASSKFRNALEYEKNNIDVLNKLGVSYFHLHKFDDALKCFGNAMQLDENNILLLYNSGLMYEMLWNTSDYVNNFYKNSAIIFYERVLTIKPQHYESLISLGLLFYKTEDYENAKLKLEEAMKIQNNDWRLLLAYGCVLSDGFYKYEEAKDNFKKSITLNQNSIIAKMNLSQVLILLNEYDESERHLKEILKKLEEIEDRSTSLILRILLICSQALSQEKVSKIFVDELLEFCELKDLQLVHWNFNNLISHVNNSKIDSKLKKLLSIILPIPNINESNKEQILQQIRKLANQQQIGSEKIKITSKSNPDTENEPWYYWELCIKAPPEVMQSIRSVEYVLDPTYKESKKTMFTKENGFLLKGKGWRDFNLRANILFDNKKVFKKYHKIILAK
jgi:tetratricopeptide (TPR) repeat protein